MSHPASQAMPILAVAATLGFKVTGRKARCFNGAAHQGGIDENPSLVFQTDVNRFKCYSCGAKGDAIDLVRGALGVSFPEAVQRLEGMAGRSPRFGPTTSAVAALAAPTSRPPTSCALDVYRRLHELSFRPTKDSPAGAYLMYRGIDPELAAQHHVAEVCAPSSVGEQLMREFGGPALQAAGLISQQNSYLFAGRQLLFFHFDGGRPRFVTARDITGQSSCKEMSLAGVRAPVPYLVEMLHTRPDRVLVCEGCIDTLSAVQLGYAAVGVAGVAGFRDDWFPMFRGIGQVTVLFDNDDAGRRQGAELRAKFRMQGIQADAKFPAHGKDINDLLLSLNPEIQHER
ncbi:MAG: toprim domain-containing protein [Planctomycetota bacterium]